MAEKRLIEVFTAGCPVCKEAVKQVKAIACDSCEVKVYDLNKGCKTNICRTKAKKYGVKSVPAVAINGKLADCCKGRGINLKTLKALGLGKSR
ncbi:MAG: thioredoxin family protein [Planctomycetes bacterium]|nr:thioredoxin family protein [Planctomycetota bacterium]